MQPHRRHARMPGLPPIRPAVRAAAGAPRRASRTRCCAPKAAAADASAPSPPVVAHGDAHQDLVGHPLGVFDRDVEIPALIEYAGVDQFEFRFLCRGARFSQ